MDMLDPALDSSSQDIKNGSPSSDEDCHLQADDGSMDPNEDDTPAVGSGTTSIIDPNTGLQYQFRAENGQGGVTYRVIQVSQGGEETTESGPSHSLVPGFGGQQGVQVVSSPYSNGGSPSGEGQTEPRFTYFPAVSSDATNEGQFYVMMSPQDVLGSGQRSIAPRTQFTPKTEGARTTRDERRRATHNEVERRRRDKINNWIIKLAKIVPECALEHTKSGNLSKSKGGILAKACDYIQELRSSNQRLMDSLKENERLSVDVELLRQQCEELKSENAVLRVQLQQNGLVAGNLSGQPS